MKEYIKFGIGFTIGQIIVLSVLGAIKELAKSRDTKAETSTEDNED